MQGLKGVRKLVLLTVAVLVASAILSTGVSSAPGQPVHSSWVYDWAWQGYYVRYHTYLIRRHVYVIQVAPETLRDDPDLFVGTSRPVGTNDPRCSPTNYLWKSRHGAGRTDSIRFTAGYTGYHYFCVYAYRPNWVGWYVRVRRLS